jgi:hypothetical protein
MLVDLTGKGRRVRTVAVPVWVKQGINSWMSADGIEDGRLLRSIWKGGRIGDTLSDWGVWSVVERSAKQIGTERFGAHDLRRTCAKLCRKAGGDLEQIKFLLGHSSIQTTEHRGKLNWLFTPNAACGPFVCLWPRATYLYREQFFDFPRQGAEAMTGQFPASCNLRWQELLTQVELQNWVLRQQLPKRLSTELAYAGVYRFIFSEARDGGSAHTPCYVGEAGRISRRLLDHFRLERDGTKEGGLNTLKLRPGWQVRGSIRNSAGDFKLQVLTIEGPVNFCGLTFGPNSILKPFDDSFLRRMLENWAILASEYVDHLHPLNRRGTPHVFEDLRKHAPKKSSRTARKSNNHAKHAAALGALLNEALKAKIPGAAAIHPLIWRENLRTYLVQIPGRDRSKFPWMPVTA